MLESIQFNAHEAPSGLDARGSVAGGAVFRSLRAWLSRRASATAAADVASGVGDTASTQSPAGDLVSALYVQLASLRSSATLKIGNRSHWREVGDLEGSAYVLLSLVLETLPRMRDRSLQTSCAVAYLDLAKAIYQKYFSDYDEDGYGAASFGPFLRVAADPTWDSSGSEPPDFQQDAGIALKASWRAAPAFGLDVHTVEVGLVSAARGDTRSTIRVLESYVLSLKRRLSEIIDSEELGPGADGGAALEESFQRSIGMVLATSLRGMRILSIAGVPYHPVRYALSMALQTSINTHRINNPLSSLDQAAIDGAISEFLARSALIDERSGNADLGLQGVNRSLAAVLISSHAGTYGDPALPSQAGLDLPSMATDQAFHLICSVNLLHARGGRHGWRELQTAVETQALSARARLVEDIGAHAWTAVARSIGESCAAESVWSDALAWLDRALSSAVLPSSPGDASRQPLLPCFEEMRAAAIIALTAVVVPRVAEVDQRQLRRIVVLLSAIRDKIRTPDLADEIVPDPESVKWPGRAQVLIYFRPLNMLALWRDMREVNSLATADLRAATRIRRTATVLATMKDRDDFFKAYAEAERAETEYRVELQYSSYVVFHVRTDTGVVTFQDLEHSAPIDRMIGDYRGVVQGFGRAEERVRLIPPKRFSATFMTGGDPPTDENYYIPLKAGRLRDHLLPVLEPGAGQILVVPEGEIFRLPLNAILLPEDQDGGSSRMVAKFFSLSQLIKRGQPVEPHGIGSDAPGAVISSPIYDLDESNGRSDLDLPHSAMEADRILEIAGGLDLRGARASKKAVLALSAPRFIHFSTHMISPDETALASDNLAMIYGGLMFTLDHGTLARQRAIGLSGLASRYLRGQTADDEFQDGILSGDDFRGLKLNGTRFITFAGCDSATTTVDSATVLNGFVRDAFLHGVDFAIGTAWPLHDQSAAVFFPHFYSVLAEGHAAGAAFLAALKRVRAASETTFEWGGFEFFGDPFATVSFADHGLDVAAT